MGQRPKAAPKGDECMTEKRLVQKPLTEQILDSMFVDLERKGVFDTETLQSLRQLAKSGNLRKPRKVIEAIHPAPEAKT